MSFSSGFFNSKNMDRTYSAEDFTTYLSTLICNGVLDTYGDQFAVSKKSGTEIVIGTGKAWINGHYFVNDAEYVIDVSGYADASLHRIIVIAICCDVSEAVRDCHLEIITGTPANTPAIPFPENTADKTYLTLAAVRLSAASDTPVFGIIDYRSDESRCGYCKCILGKCKVTELLAQMEKITEQFSKQQQTIKEMSTSLDSIKRRLGMINYTYPDANGDGKVTADEAALVQEFLGRTGSGEYSGYATQKEKWAAFAEEKGLENSVFPDANGDGTLGSDDAVAILSFAAASGADGEYLNTEEDFKRFMLEEFDNAILGYGISGFRVMTQERYNRLTKPKADIQYSIIADPEQEAADEAE